MNISNKVLVSLTLSIALVACGGNECDPNQKFEDNICKDVPTKVPEADAAVADAGATPVPSDDGDFAKNCMTDAECVDQATFCAVQPGQASGYCTAKLDSCDQIASLCPPGWSCLELGKFQPGLPTICTKPAS